MFRQIPNLLTILRIVASFAFVPVVLADNFKTATLIFAIASLSDFFDGFLARKLKIESDFGRMLDPLADKILMIASYFTFSYADYIPVYIALIVIGRDVLILSVILISRLTKISLTIKPLLSSKINTTIQLIFIIIVLACKCFSINVPSLIQVCSFVVCVSTIFSGIDYFRNYYWIKDAVCKRKTK